MRTFLQAIWPQPFISAVTGTVVFWMTPSKKSIHLSVDQIAELEDDDQIWLMDEANRVGPSNVYFGLGLRRLGTERQGGKKDIVALPGFALDIDFFDPRAHKAMNLPRDLDEAAQFLEGVPDPTIIVNTGNGVHLYWLFLRPLLLDSMARIEAAQKAFSRFQAPIIQRAKQLELHVDSTASVQRVWRLPGFINQKTSKEVELLHLGEVRYTLEELGTKISPKRASYDKRVETEEEETEEEFEYEDVDLEELKKALTRVSPSNIWRDAIKALLNEESMAPKGKRDSVLQGVCSTIAFHPLGRKADPRVLAELFIPSLEVWAEEEDADKTAEEEYEKVVDKISRSQADYWEREKRERPKLEGMAKVFGIDLNKEPPEEEGGLPNDFFTSRAIIAYKEGYYGFDFRSNEFFPRPLRSSELQSFARDAWAEDVGAPDSLSVEYTDNKGRKKLKSVQQILFDYATPAKDAHIDLMVDKSFYDLKTKIFVEAGAKKRVTEAVYHPQVDEWLRLLSGSSYDDLANWISVVAALDQPNSALYLDGESGAGKGLLATGLAHLWLSTGTPTPFEEVIGNYNSPLVNCPLAWIDEGLKGRKTNVTGELRAFIGRSSFVMNEKYMPHRLVRGHTRLMICANNKNVLKIGGSEFTVMDLKAVTGRILHIKARKEAVDYLANNGGWDFTSPWIKQDAIAKHALYLAETREFEHGRRFMVEGNETSLHRQMVLHGENDALTYEWLARFSTDPKKIEGAYKARKEESLAFFNRGFLYINTQCVIDCWKQYMGETVEPSHNNIGGLLRRLAHRQVRLVRGSKRNRFWIIKLDMILEWCRENQIGNEDQILINMEQDNGEIEDGDEEIIEDD